MIERVEREIWTPRNRCNIGTGIFFPGLAAARRAFPSSLLGITPPGSPYNWYRADVADLWTNFLGNAHVANDGDGIGQWSDLGSANALANEYSNNSTPPQYKVNRINSHDTVLFPNGAQSAMLSSTGISLATMSVFVVAKIGQFGIGVTYMLGGAGFLFGNNDSSTFWIYQGTSVITGGTPDLNWHYYSGQFSADANCTMWRDGTIVAGPGNGGSSTITAINIGADNRGGSPSHGAFYNGEIAEVLIYTPYLNSTDRQTVEAYLKARYAL